jgi:hypothetical protein
LITPLSKQGSWFLALAFALLTVIFHSYHLGYASYDLDEAVHIWYAQGSFSQVIEQSSNDPNPPIYNLIISTWVKVFGVTESSVRFFSVLMGALGVALMFLIASRNFGMAVGIMAALFYCLSPIQFRFTHLARPYSMLMVTVLLSYGALLECLKDPNLRKLFWYYLATTLMIYVHPTSIFNLPAQGIIVVFFHYDKIKTIIRLALPMIAAVATFGVWMLVIPYFERNDTMWFGPPTWEDIWYVIKVFYGNGWLIVIQLVVLVLFFLRIKRQKEKSMMLNAILLAVWIIVPFMISVCFSHLVKPVFQDKYILSVQPAVMLLLALTLDGIGSWKLRNAGVLVALILLISSLNTKPHPEGDWRSAVAFVNSIQSDNSAVLIDPWYEYRTFCYYFDRHAYQVPDSTIKILASKRAFTSWDDVYDEHNQVPKVDVVHLVFAHQGFVEPEVSMERVESIAGLIGVKEFIGIKVMSYQFGKTYTLADSIGLNSIEGNEGPILVDSKNEFPATVSSTLNKNQDSKVIKVLASVKIRSSGDLEGVQFVATVERPDAPMVEYRSIELQTREAKDGLIEITEQITVSNYQSDWFVKAYVWNVGKKEFQIEDLNLVVQY